MIKILWRFALLILAAMGFAWLADRPGHISITWLGRDIELSVLAGVAFLLAALAIIYVLWRITNRIWRSPTAAREYWRFRKHRKAYDSLSRGIIAAGAGDAQGAARHASIASATLKDEPLVNLLSAQAAQLKGDRAGVKRAFEDMTKSSDTELLGLRGLFAEAKQMGDWPAARKYAEAALAKNARLPWASTAVLQVQTTAKDWAQAAATIANQNKAGILTRDESSKKQAALLAAQAIAEEESNKTRALSLAQDALGLDGALVPAALVAARCLIADGNSKKAIKILRNSWTTSPHPELAQVLLNAKPNETSEEKFERTRDFVGAPEKHVEAACALSRAAIQAKRFDVAKTSLQAFTEDHPQARVCGLMAEIEDAQGDKGRSREWLARALHATRDPMWVSDGVASNRWVPVSPVTGEIVLCEWKVPYEMADAPQWQLQTSTETPQLAAPAEPTKPPQQARLPDDPGVDDTILN
jgi:HemY protein